MEHVKIPSSTILLQRVGRMYVDFLIVDTSFDTIDTVVELDKMTYKFATLGEKRVFHPYSATMSGYPALYTDNVTVE